MLSSLMAARGAAVPRSRFDDDDERHSTHRTHQGQAARGLRSADGFEETHRLYVDLAKNKRIVQAWRAAGWPKGHFSIVSFDLKSAGAGTLLEFTHVGIPSHRLRSINYGWKHYYWKPLKAAVEKKSRAKKSRR